MATIGIIGGSGMEGRGLGLRFALAGHSVLLGSRDAGRAQEAADAVSAIAPGVAVSGALNHDAAAHADVVVLSVPHDGLAGMVGALASQLNGKVVISVVAPLTFDGGMPSAVLLPEGSAAELVQGLLPDSRVTSAFHNLSARELLKADEEIEGDVIVCGDDAEAKALTIGLAEAIPNLRGIDGGPVQNSRAVEEMTALLLYVNKQTKGRATIKLLGI